MIRCILVDDEPLARERFRVLLEKADYEAEVVGEAESGAKAIPLVYELKPNVMFLDIQMPGLSGFEVVDLLAQPRPHIVFVTAYDEYALKAFEVHALDYLTKPVRLERLNKALAHLSTMQSILGAETNVEAFRKERGNLPLSRLTVHAGQRLRVVNLTDIRRIEAESKFVYVYLADGRYRTDFTLDELERRLDGKQFLRVHRSHLVRIESVKEIIPWFSGTYCVKLDDGTQLPVARRRIAELKGLFGTG